MPLSQTQRAVWEKARTLGSGAQAVQLDDSACSYLVARIAADLDLLDQFPEFETEIPYFFARGELDALEIEGLSPLLLFERLAIIYLTAQNGTHT